MLKTGSLEPRRATDIIRQVASALDAAHAAGLIHRDVKPQNIIVTPDDFAYLVDFGIAEARGDTHLTMAGHTVGTFDYMAPERFGDEETTSAVDVYALACVLYEALTGAKPFPVHSAEQAIRAHLSSPPPRPSAVNPHVPASFDDVIARGMAKHPDDRYGSAGALGRAAKRALAPDPATSAGTNTLLAPQYVSAPSSYPPFAAQYPYPATGPVSATDADQGGSKKLMVLTIVGSRWRSWSAAPDWSLALPHNEIQAPRSHQPHRLFPIPTPCLPMRPSRLRQVPSRPDYPARRRRHHKTPHSSYTRSPMTTARLFARNSPTAGFHNLAPNVRVS